MVWYKQKVYYNVAELYNEAAGLVSAGYNVNVDDSYDGWIIIIY